MSALASRPVLAVTLATVALAGAVQAAPSRWDVLPGTVSAGNGTIDDGTGSWDTSLGNWTTDGGLTNVAWIDGNDALFGGGSTGTAGVVTIGGAGVSATSLTFDAPAAGTYSIGGGTLTLTGIATITTNSDATINSVIDGTAGLTKAGTGNLTLTGSSIYSGITTVSAGKLTLSDSVNDGVGALRGTVNVNSGATLAVTTANSFGFGVGTKIDALNINGGTVTSSINGDNGWGIAISMTAGSLTATSGGRFTLGGGSSVTTLAAATSSTISAALTLREGNPNNTVPFDVADGAAARDLLITAAISGTGVSLTKTGAGTLTLSNVAETYTGGTIVNAGVLELNRTVAGNILAAVNGVLTIKNGGTVSITGNQYNLLGSGPTSAPVSIEAGGTLSANSSSNNATNLGAVSLSGGTMSSTGGLNDGGFGNFIFNGPVTVTGDTPSNITASRVSVNGTQTFNVSDGAAAVDLNIASLVIGGSFTKDGAGTMRLTAANAAYANAITVNAGTLELNRAATGASVAAAASFTVKNGGTLRLSGNQYNVLFGNAVTVEQGGLFTADSTANNAHNLGALTLKGGTVSSAGVSDATFGTFVLGGTVTQTADAPSTINAHSVALSGDRTFAVADTAAADDLIIDSPLRNSFSVLGGLIKTGTGTLRLNGTNTYSSVTTVSGGTLLVNGSLTGAGAVTVAAGATLGGSGSIGGAATISGTLDAGTGIASFGTNAVTFNTGSTLSLNLDSSAAPDSAADVVLTNGALNLSGTVNLSLSDLASSPTAFAEGTIFSLINYSGAWNGGTFTLGGGNVLDDEEVFSLGLNSWRIDYDALTEGVNFAEETTYANSVNLIAVPEPGTASALLGGLAILAGCSRRRRNA